jgi:hypothetical protein
MDANSYKRMKKVMLEMSLDQANALAFALDTYTRLCIGQLEEIESMVRWETIPMGESQSQFDRVDRESARRTASPEVCDQIGEMMKKAKVALGYSANGSNGIGHKNIHLSGRRAYEINKVLVKALAEQKNPNPGFKGVDYDGLILRYTQDPIPLATVVEDEQGKTKQDCVK